MKVSKKFIFTVLLFYTTLNVFSQTLPALGTAPEITVGSFPNGIKYYIAKNSVASGYADYALVQKCPTDEERSRSSLLALPHFDLQAPYDFLASKGVGYSRFGYIQAGQEATIYRFENVPTTDVAASDSTLMMLFDLCAMCTKEQAVIVSGDIDPGNVKGKMSIFSLMIPKLEEVAPDTAYRFLPRKAPILEVGEIACEGVTSISARFSAPRRKADAMNTSAAYVTDMLFGETSNVIRKRIIGNFRSARVSLANVDVDYVNSAAGSGDESLSVTVYVEDQDRDIALTLLAKTLSSLGSKGASEREMSDAKAGFLSGIDVKVAEGATSNSEYIQRCISSYLYGFHLSPASDAKEFFASRVLPAKVETSLLNKFASALLSDGSNVMLTLCSNAHYPSDGESLRTFLSAWKAAQEEDGSHHTINFADTQNFITPAAKVKIKAETSEPLTAGTMWTFSNGMRVIYKKAPTRGEFIYAMMVRGGYPLVEGLGKGEGAYVSDITNLYDVAGINCYDFTELLGLNGISMKVETGISDLRITGQAPSGRLPLVMKSIAAYASQRSFNKEAYNYYRRCESLRRKKEATGTNYSLLSDADKALRPNYEYTPYKYDIKLDDSFPSKVTSYLDSQFSRMSDGVFVLYGDLDDLEVKKQLCKYLGAFQTGKSFTARPQLQYLQRAGTSPLRRDAVGTEEECIAITLSTVGTVNMENYMAFKVALMAVQKKVTNALKDYGMWLEIEDNVETFPLERLCATFICRQSYEMGLPKGIGAKGAREAVFAVRKAVGESLDSSISKAEMTLFKNHLLKTMDTENSRPGSIVNAALKRYSEGKDLFSSYNTAINGLTAVKVQDMMASLKAGGRVEYLVF